MAVNIDDSIIYTDNVQELKDIQYFNVEVDAKACTRVFNANQSDFFCWPRE